MSNPKTAEKINTDHNNPDTGTQYWAYLPSKGVVGGIDRMTTPTTLETIDLTDSDAITEWTWRESDWIVFADYINGICYEYNRKTGEMRPYDQNREVK